MSCTKFRSNLVLKDYVAGLEADRLFGTHVSFADPAVVVEAFFGFPIELPSAKLHGAKTVRKSIEVKGVADQLKIG